MKLSLSGLEKFRDLGLVVMRVTIGLTYMHFGWNKLVGGPQMWRQVGSAMGNFGINFGSMYWGMAATFAELLGGLLLVIGLWVRAASMALCGTMLVASWLMLQYYSPTNQDSAIKFYYPLSMLAVTFAMIFLGGGKFSVEGGSGGGSSRGSSEGKSKK